MKWLFRGRTPKRWRSALHKVSASVGVPTPPPPRAQPRELVDVLGVGISQIRGPSTLTLLSLERYGEGFILQFRLLHERHHRRQLFMPQLELSIVDGRATRYTVWPQGGGGGGGLDGLMEWRYAYAGTPHLPEEGEITVDAAEIRWQRHDDKGGMVLAATDPGPWRFTIALPPSGTTP